MPLEALIVTLNVVDEDRDIMYEVIKKFITTPNNIIIQYLTMTAEF